MSPEKTAAARSYKSFKGAKRQAQAELTRLLAQAGEGNHVDPTRLTVGEHVRARFEHWKLAKIISPMTAQRYGELIENNIVPYLGARQLQRLNTLDIETWHAALRAHGRKGRWVRRQKRGRVERPHHRPRPPHLSKALSEAMKHGLIAKNVCTLERAPKIETEEVQILTLEQVDELPSMLHGHPLEAPALVSLHTGMRRGELLALRWGNVDLKSSDPGPREPRATRGATLQGARAKAGRRDITLPAAAVDLLEPTASASWSVGSCKGRAGSLTATLYSLLGMDAWAPNSFGAAWSSSAAN